MATVAVLGMGLLGSGFAEHLIELGHAVRVWNRTAAKCAPLAALGAVHAETPEEAVRGAERVHLVLSADAAVDAVIAALRPGLGDGVPILDHSTNLPAAVASRFSRLRGEGVQYLHLPVFMGPANARQGNGLMLACGPAAEIEALASALAAMTGRVLFLGERPEQAAAIKLTGNGLLIMMAGVMGDLLRMGRTLGLAPEETLALFDEFAPTPGGMGKRVLSAGERPVTFELSMARKDIGLMIDAGGGADKLVVLPAIAAAMDDLLADGRGAEDFARFAHPDEA